MVELMCKRFGDVCNWWCTILPLLLDDLDHRAKCGENGKARVARDCAEEPKKVLCPIGQVLHHAKNGSMATRGVRSGGTEGWAPTPLPS